MQKRVYDLWCFYLRSKSVLNSTHPNDFIRIRLSNRTKPFNIRVFWTLWRIQISFFHFSYNRIFLFSNFKIYIYSSCVNQPPSWILTELRFLNNIVNAPLTTEIIRYSDNIFLYKIGRQMLFRIRPFAFSPLPEQTRNTFSLTIYFI